MAFVNHGGFSGYHDGPAENLAAVERLVGGVGFVERKAPGDDRFRAERCRGRRAG